MKQLVAGETPQQPLVRFENDAAFSSPQLEGCQAFKVPDVTSNAATDTAIRPIADTAPMSRA